VRQLLKKGFITLASLVSSVGVNLSSSLSRELPSHLTHLAPLSQSTLDEWSSKQENGREENVED